MASPDPSPCPPRVRDQRDPGDAETAVTRGDRFLGTVWPSPPLGAEAPQHPYFRAFRTSPDPPLPHRPQLFQTPTFGTSNTELRIQK